MPISLLKLFTFYSMNLVVERSYVDAGHDVLCAEDNYGALHLGNVMKKYAVAVEQVEEKTILIRIKIPKITRYHSFEFNDTHMVMWKYFGIGQGVVWKSAGSKGRCQGPGVRSTGSWCPGARFQYLQI